LNINQKEWKKIFIFGILIFIFNILLVLYYIDGYFLNDETFFLIHAKDNYNPFLYVGWAYYRPIPLSIIEIQYILFGLNPIPYHLTSIIINSVNSFIFFLISRQIFKNQLTPYFAVIIFMSFYILAFEVILWIGDYFDLFLVFFLSSSILFFIKSYKAEKNNTLFFLLSGIFVNLAFLSKETAVLIIPTYIIFNFFHEENIKLFLKKSWKYLIFSPIIVIFLIFRQNSKITPWAFNFGTIMILLIAVIISLPLIVRIKIKMSNPNEIFISLLTIISCYSLVFTSFWRGWAFPSIGASLWISNKLLRNFNHNSFRDVIKHALNLQYLKTKKIYVTIFALFFCFSYALYGYAKYDYYRASKLTLNMSNTIINDNAVGKNIYIVNVHYFLLTCGGYESHLELSIYLINDTRININYILIDDENLYKSYGHIIFDAEIVSIEEYNLITQDPSNQVYLCDMNILNIRNITNVLYNDW